MIHFHDKFWRKLSVVFRLSLLSIIVSGNIPNDKEAFALTHREAQEMLRQLYFYDGTVDGIWGPLSKKAIRTYQRTLRLKVTGTLNEETSDALVSRFMDAQMLYRRVRAAYTEKETTVKDKFMIAGIRYPPKETFIRIFKKEQILEVWARADIENLFSLIDTYRFSKDSGRLGPKRSIGDWQIPEGFYHIDRYNADSYFHLSLGINYPNASDRFLSNHRNPGGNIFIHGGNETIGCIPITDDKIKELYIIAVEARNNGHLRIPVHIFPTRMDDEGMAYLRKYGNPGFQSFWRNIKPVYIYFEEYKALPNIRVSRDGTYLFE